MKIAIISDIHDNLVNLNKFLNWIKKNKIESVICCGDITNNETLNELAKFSGAIYMVSGNIKLFDDEHVPQHKNIKYFDKILKEKKCDIVFYGHTHRPWEDNKNNVKCINPGTLSATFQRATFAVWNTKTEIIELKILDIL